jgi:signal transduction histidine kinase
LQELNATLEQRVAERTAELRRLNVALRAEIARARQLQGEILKATEREQRRIGQDLHDSLGQITTGAAMMSEGLEQDLLARPLPREARVAGRLTKLCRSLGEEARRLAHGLNPVAPSADGLMIALQGLAQSTRKLLRVRCRFLCASPVMMPDSSSANHLFRIAQEAVHNAVRHARPELIRIALRQDKIGLSLSIADDGCGLPPEATSGPGMGLKLMRHRADLIGAAIRFEPGRPRGTRVICSLPRLPRKQEAPAATVIVRARHRAARSTR